MSRQYTDTLPVLVVGGEPSFVKAKLGQTLQRHGLHVKSHWRWRRKRLPSALPAVRAVYVLTDMCGHSLNDIAVTMAKKKGVPVIYGTRKWAESSQRLVAAGFPLTKRRLPKAVKEIVDMSTPAQPKRPRGRPPSPHREERKRVYKAALKAEPSLNNPDAHRVATELLVEEGASCRAAEEIMSKSPRPRLLREVRQELDLPVRDRTLQTRRKPHPQESSPLPSAIDTPREKIPSERSELPDWWDGDIVSAIEMMREQMSASNVISIEITADSIRWKRAVIEEGVFKA